ncbi:MAG: DUF5615 family PIN-like protein [Candidatus Baldrarchaeia archaeon]
MKFICDSMLGRLARWLRLLGCDVIYAGTEIDDDKILQIAKNEGRVILTSDAELHSRAQKLGIQSILLRNYGFVNLLAEVLARFEIPPVVDPNCSRCPYCNGVVVYLRREDVSKMPDVLDVLSPNIIEAHEEFWRCTKCGKIYWKGRMWRNINRILEKVKEEMMRIKKKTS